MGIMEDVQNLDLGTIVEMYDIDLTAIGYNQILYFTPSAGANQSIFYGDFEYLPRGIEMTGFSKSSNDAPPEPTLTISNVDKGGNALLATYDSLIGAKVTRRRTLAKYLDRLADGVTPNPGKSWNSQFMPETWYVEQKEEGNRILVKWRMRSVLDLEGLQLPRRRVQKSFCERTYRVKDATTDTFDYATTRACPYAGAGMWDRFGNVTALKAEDECDKTHKGCALRFPDGLPTWAFPGADKIPS